MLNREKFVGPWAGLPIAWNDNDQFDETTYRSDLARCCRAGVPGVYTCGTTGEFYALEWEEFQAVTRATIETCRQFRTPVMLGCTATSTRGAARRAAFAAEIGADAIQLALPFWLEMQDAEVLPFFRDVAEAAPGLPISIYETARAKKCLSAEQHRDIHHAVPQYVMVKSQTGTVGATEQGCRELSNFINVFVSESQWAELGPHGAVGCCSSMVYWNPRVVLRAWHHLRSKDWAALERDCCKIIELHEYLFDAFGSRGFTDTAYDRTVARSTGFLQTSLRARGPYASPTTDDVRMLREWLSEHYPEMLDHESDHESENLCEQLPDVRNA